MRLVFFGALLLALMIFGCCAQMQTTPAQDGTGAYDQGAQNFSPIAGGNQGNASEGSAGATNPPEGEGTIVDVGGSIGTAAISQADCATRASNCGECVAKENCGWCKSRNGCFYGDPSGPADVTCESGWATTDSGCAGPVGGSACSSKTNCADCLSGSGCQWCIQGSKCVDDGSIDQCFGGWLKQSYQCNYASR